MYVKASCNYFACKAEWGNAIKSGAPWSAKLRKT